MECSSGLCHDPHRGAGTIGLLSAAEARKDGVEEARAAQKAAIHVEFSSDNLDDLYEELKGTGVVFHQPPMTSRGSGR